MTVKCTYRVVNATIPGAQDPRARSKDIDKASVVGVRCPRIVASRCPDSADGRFRGRAERSSVCVAVSSCHGEEDSRLDHGGGGGVDGRGRAAAERHVGYGAVGAVTCLRVGGDKVHAVDHS